MYVSHNHSLLNMCIPIWKESIWQPLLNSTDEHCRFILLVIQAVICEQITTIYYHVAHQTPRLTYNLSMTLYVHVQVNRISLLNVAELPTTQDMSWSIQARSHQLHRDDQEMGTAL